MKSLRGLYVVAFALGVTHVPFSEAAEPIGTAAIVENGVTSTPSDSQTPVAMRRGDRLFENERVETAQDGKAQLLFADESALSMDPNSSIVLDKFVYDPKPNVGNIVLETVTGSFRFVGGTADSVKGSSYTVKTPVGTIGIRGTLFEWEVKGGSLTAVLREGAIDVCATGGSCTALTKPGTYIVTRGTQLSGVSHWDGKGSDAIAINRTSTSTDPLYQQHLNTIGASAPITQVTQTNSGGGNTQNTGGGGGGGGGGCTPRPGFRC